MIRDATVDDVLAIEMLMKSISGFWQDSWRPDVLQRGIESSNGLAFVYVEANKIVGFACAHDIGFRAYLSELVVSGDYHKKGIGKRLVQHIQSELKKRGCAVLISDVWRDAESFYKKLGWIAPEVILLAKRL